MMLQKPIAINGLQLKNRLVMPPMATKIATETGEVTGEIVEHYRRRAQGVGLVILEHSFVSPQGRAGASQISLASDDALEGLRQLTAAIHAAGSPVFAQLNHVGGMGDPALTGGEIVSASAVQNPAARVQGYIPRALEISEIQEIEAQFVRAAVRAKNAGFDGVELHSAHAYLLNEFYSPLTNHRSDEYGGSLEHRLRIHCEIVRAVRAAVGEDYPIALRLGGCDYMPHGNTVEDAALAGKILEDAGVDLLDISGGMCRYIRQDCTDAGYFADSAGAVRCAVSVPVLLTGGITTPEQAERFLQAQQSDLIGVGRAILKDPDWAKKIKTFR